MSTIIHVYTAPDPACGIPHTGRPDMHAALVRAVTPAYMCACEPGTPSTCAQHMRPAGAQHMRPAGTKRRANSARTGSPRPDRRAQACARAGPAPSLSRRRGPGYPSDTSDTNRRTGRPRGARGPETRATRRMARPAATATASVAMAATAAEKVEADLMAAAVATTTVAGGGPQGLSLRCETGVRSDATYSARANAQQARDGTDIAQAGGDRRKTTCQSPRLGRDGHVGRRKRSLPAHTLSAQLVWSPPCLRGGRPAAVRRAQSRVRWCAEAVGSGRRASGAGGAQQQGLAHLQRLKMFQSLQAAGPLVCSN